MLEEYKRKRSFQSTPEPADGVSKSPGFRFVVQKHRASHLHFDFRLEMNGVLVSWAVPKGPSLDPADKRLAMETEDHPVEYADFEGVIPKGNYGAGPMIVWDRGRWEPVGDPRAGYEAGKILFELKGFKLKGKWTLVRTKGRKEWLLIKETGDGHVRRGGTYDDRSVLSGLRVSELHQRGRRAGAKPRHRPGARTCRGRDRGQATKCRRNHALACTNRRRLDRDPVDHGRQDARFPRRGAAAQRRRRAVDAEYAGLDRARPELSHQEGGAPGGRPSTVRIPKILTG